MRDSDLTDLNKIDIIQPTPRDSALELSKGVYTVGLMLHIPPQPPSDWSSEDWDGKKAKAKEQRLLIDFKLLEQQLQNTLQAATQDAASDKQEMYLINKMQDLTLEWDQNSPNMTDMSVPPPDAPETKHKGAKEDDLTMM